MSPAAKRVEMMTPAASRLNGHYENVPPLTSALSPSAVGEDDGDEHEDESSKDTSGSYSSGSTASSLVPANNPKDHGNSNNDRPRSAVYVTSNPGGVQSSAGSPFGIVIPRSPKGLVRGGSEPSLTPRRAVGLPSKLASSARLAMQDSSSSSLNSEDEGVVPGVAAGDRRYGGPGGPGAEGLSPGRVKIDVFAPPPPPLESKGVSHPEPLKTEGALAPPAPVRPPARDGKGPVEKDHGGDEDMAAPVSAWGSAVWCWVLPLALSFILPIAGIVIVCLVGVRSTARFAGLLVLGLLLAIALFLAVGFDRARWGKDGEGPYRRKFLCMWAFLIVGAIVTTPVVTVVSRSRPDYGAAEQFRLEGSIFFAATGPAPRGCVAAQDSELARAVLLGPRTAMSPVTGCVRLAAGLTLRAGTAETLDSSSSACRNSETPTLFTCASPVPVTLVDLESAPAPFPPEALARLPNGTAFAAITGASATSTAASSLCGTHGIRVPDGWSVASYPGDAIASMPFSRKHLILADGSCVSSTLATCGEKQLLSYGKFVATTSCDRVVLLVARTAPVSSNGTVLNPTPVPSVIPSSLPPVVTGASQMAALAEARLINQSSVAPSSLYIYSAAGSASGWRDVVADTSGTSPAVMTASLASSSSTGAVSRVASARSHAVRGRKIGARQATQAPSFPQIWVTRLRNLENLDLTKPQDLSLQIRIAGFQGVSSPRALNLVRAASSSWDVASGLVSRPYLSAYMASSASLAAGDAAGAPPAPALVNLFVDGLPMGLHAVVPSAAEGILSARPSTLYIARFASPIDFSPSLLASAGAQPQLIYTSSAAAAARAAADLADLASVVANPSSPLITLGLFSRENALAVLALVSSTGACGLAQAPFYLSAELAPSSAPSPPASPRLVWRLTWGASPDTTWTGSACDVDPLPLPYQRLARNPILARFLSEITVGDIGAITQRASSFLADSRMGWERSAINATAAAGALAPRAFAPTVLSPWPVEIVSFAAARCPSFTVTWSDLVARTAGASLLLRQGPDMVAHAFDVEVSDLSDFTPASATVVNRTAVTETSVTTPSLQLGNRYFVRVSSRYIYVANGSYASAASAPASNSYLTSRGRLLLGVASFVASCTSNSSSPTPAPTAAPSASSEPPASPSATPKPAKPSDYRVASISEVVVIAGTVFASIDNVDPLDRGSGCSRSLRSLPSPWVVAAPEGPARLLLSSARFGFDTECVVLSSGAAVSTAGGGPCAPPVALSSYLVIASGNATGTLAFAAECSASGMGMRVLVSRPAGPADLASAAHYDPEALASVPEDRIRVTKTGPALQLATIDGADPEDRSSDCQGPRAIPAGWALAQYTTYAVDVLAYKPWGTECLVFAGGVGMDISGMPCGPGNASAVVNRVGAYHAPSFCDARLVISRPMPAIPCVPECAAGRGVCVGRTGRCSCFPGFSGASCDGTNPLFAAFPSNFNFSVVDPANGRAPGFSAFGSAGYTVAPASFGTSRGGPTSRSIVANLTSSTASGGLALPLSLATLRSLLPTSAPYVVVGVSSLAYNVSTTLTNTDYSLYMDTTTTSAGSVWQGFRFSPTAQGWQYGELILNVNDTLSLNAYLMFRNRAGVAYFSDLTLRLPCDGVTCLNGGACAPATGRCACVAPFFGAQCASSLLPPFVEDKSVYTLHADDDQAASVGPPVFWITALDTDNYKYSDLIADMNPDDSFEPTIGAEISTTNDLPNMVGGASTFVNVSATMARRGSASRLQFKPSFKYALKSRTWRGFSTVHLAAVDWDNTKVRNVVSMKLFREVPHLGAARVFLVDVNMRIGRNGNWTRLGLHNCIEQVNTNFLAERGLDSRSALFKAQQYTFSSTPGLRLTTEPGFNLTTFETSFSVGGALDTRAIVGFTRDLADTANFPSIGMVLDKHVNLDNFMSWLASMILVYHFDSTVHNWLWYSRYSQDGVGLYWIPYDCDGCLRNRPDVGQFNQPNTWGINLFWALPFFRRVLSEVTYRDMLINRVDQLRNTVFTESNVRSKIEPIRELVKTSSADPAFVELELDAMIGSVTDFYNKFKWSLTAPLVTRLSISADKTQAVWVPSTHLLGLPVTYSISAYRDSNNLNGSLVGTFPAPCSQGASLCSFSRPPSLTAGTTYYLVMTFTDTNNSTMTADGGWVCTSGLVYGDRLCTVWTPSA